jgi:hypothetical protein
LKKVFLFQIFLRLANSALLLLLLFWTGQLCSLSDYSLNVRHNLALSSPVLLGTFSTNLSRFWELFPRRLSEHFGNLTFVRPMNEELTNTAQFQSYKNVLFFYRFVKFYASKLTKFHYKHQVVIDIGV